MLKLGEASLDTISLRYQTFKGSRVKFRQKNTVEVYIPKLHDWEEVTSRFALKFLRSLDIQLDAGEIHKQQEAFIAEHNLPEDAFDLTPLPGEKWYSDTGNDRKYLRVSHISNFGRLRKQQSGYYQDCLSYIELPWVCGKTNELHSGNPKHEFARFRWAYGKQDPDAELDDKVQKYRKETIPEIEQFEVKGVPIHKFSKEKNITSLLRIPYEVFQEHAKLKPIMKAAAFVDRYSSQQIQAMENSSHENSLFEIKELKGEKWYKLVDSAIGNLHAISSMGRVLNKMDIDEFGHLLYIQIPKLSMSLGGYVTYIKLPSEVDSDSKEKLKFATLRFGGPEQSIEAIQGTLWLKFEHIHDWDDFVEELGTSLPVKNERFCIVRKNYRIHNKR